jgi:hypothetical protein
MRIIYDWDHILSETDGYRKNYIPFRNIIHSNQLGLEAQLAEHWTDKPKVPGVVGRSQTQSIILVMLLIDACR